MTRIGIIGTGMLGEAVGIHLLKSGHELTVFNRTKSKTDNLAKNGATISNSPMDVAKNSDLVITVVKDADSVKQVSFKNDGILAGNHDGLVVADMSTVNPESSKEISKKFQENGIDFLEIPVMGGPNVAVEGKLVLMASGNKNAYEKHQKVFETIAHKNFFLGATGTAHSIKLAMNLQISMLALALSEGITLTRKAGFEPEKFLEILNSTYFKTGMSENKAHNMIKDIFEPTFMLKNMTKDLGIINEAAKSFNAELPMAKLASKIYQDAVDAGFGEIDYTGILAYLKKISED
jgi:3-hydroxyisobutyrate dehydrogenase